MSEAAALQTQTPRPAQSGSSGLLLQRKCACGGSGGFAGECSECRSKKLLGMPLQTKLRINKPGDEYEQEADRVAERVMRMPDATPNPNLSPARETPVVQRKISVNSAAAGIGTAPPIVRDVLSAPGQPLDASSRAFFEPRFGHDFGHVRIHSDLKGAESARSINALAYTQGTHVVFGRGQYRSQTADGRELIAHELAHVVQAGASEALSNHIGNARVDRKAKEQQAFAPGEFEQVHLRADSAPLIRRREDPHLQELLEDLRTLGAVGPYGTDELAWQIFGLLREVDLSDPDNLAPISQAIAEAFPDTVLLHFLTLMEDRAQKERMFKVKSSHRVGYGLFPVTSVTVEAFGQLAQSFIRSSQAFLEGLYGGLTQAKFSEAELQALRSNLIASAVLNVVFSPVFITGVMVGIGQDAKNTITGAVEVIGNFSETVDLFGKLVHGFLADPEVARTLGEETGTHYVEEIRKKTGLDPIQFTFELGELIGPPIVYTVLSFLGFTALAGFVVFKKLSAALGRFRGAARILDFIAERFRTRANSAILQRLLQGSGLSKRPPTVELLKAREALKAGTATIEDYETLLREAVRDAREFIQAGPVRSGEPVYSHLTWEVMKGKCGIGRDCSAASFAGMASKSLKPISISRFHTWEVFGPKGFANHAFSVVNFADGSQYLVDPTFAQFQAFLSGAVEREFAAKLVKDGFIPLDDANGAVYATILRRAESAKPSPLPKTDATFLAQKLRHGIDAKLTETVGAGEEGLVYKLPGRGSVVDIVSREELLRYAEEIRTRLPATGDPYQLNESMEWLINRVENPTEEL